MEAVTEFQSTYKVRALSTKRYGLLRQDTESESLTHNHRIIKRVEGVRVKFADQNRFFAGLTIVLPVEFTRSLKVGNVYDVSITIRESAETEGEG
jgi:hypothetical protein